MNSEAVLGIVMIVNRMVEGVKMYLESHTQLAKEDRAIVLYWLTIGLGIVWVWLGDVNAGVLGDAFPTTPALGRFIVGISIAFGADFMHEMLDLFGRFKKSRIVNGGPATS